MHREANPHHSRRWWILAVIGLAQLMVVLDATIVNIALPSAQADLGFSDDSRQWVITAYALAFGSLLLLGGRLGDLFGRKRTFIVGLLGFAAASALGGAAGSFEMLVAARALQGVFGALLAPAALVAAHDHVHRPGRARQGVRRLRRDRRRRRRDRPAARRHPHRVPVLALVPVRQPRLRDPGRARRAARCCTSRPATRPRASTSPARVARPPGCSRSSTASRTPRPTAGATRSRSACLAAGVVLLAAFVAIERRVAQPAAAAAGRRSTATAAAPTWPSAVAGAGMFGVFLFLTYYLQQTLGLLAGRDRARVPADDRDHRRGAT